MELFDSVQGILDYIKAQKTSSLHISTFGIYFQDGQLEFMRNIKTKSILIGFPKAKLCKHDCPDCATRHISGMKFNIKRMLYLQSLGFDVYYSYENHLKSFIFGMKAIIGGINLTNSNYTDIAMRIDRKQVLPQYIKYRDDATLFTTPIEFAKHVKDEFKHINFRKAEFRFGKYKDFVIENILDSSYIDWYLKTIFDLTLKNEKSSTK